ADRRADQLGQTCVAEQVVLFQRLFHEQEVERVQQGQVACIRQRVCGIGVDLQQHLVAKAFAHRPNGFEVPARLDLELDAQVAFGEISADSIEQFVDRVHDANRDSSGNPVVNRTQVLAEG